MAKNIDSTYWLAKGFLTAVCGALIGAARVVNTEEGKDDALNVAAGFSCVEFAGKKSPNSLDLGLYFGAGKSEENFPLWKFAKACVKGVSGGFVTLFGNNFC